MPLVICKYCRARVRPRQLQLHYKRCLQYRRALKFGKVPDEDKIPSIFAATPSFETVKPDTTGTPDNIDVVGTAKVGTVPPDAETVKAEEAPKKKASKSRKKRT